jgi:antitoxin MazE
MRAKVQRWGNSLAVRIPKAFAEDLGLREDAPVEIGVVEGDLVVSPPPARTFTLARLLAGVTEENVHHEIETGPAVGGEVW